jgi:hypothetical protein
MVILFKILKSPLILNFVYIYTYIYIKLQILFDNPLSSSFLIFTFQKKIYIYQSQNIIAVFGKDWAWMRKFTHAVYSKTPPF